MERKWDVDIYIYIYRERELTRKKRESEPFPEMCKHISNIMLIMQELP